MSRECCTVCLRAKVACICHLFIHIDNATRVVILQHPNEVKQTKGTVTLLANSLSHCDVIIGEDFTHNVVLSDIFSLYDNNIALLYPSETATVLAPSANPVSAGENYGGEIHFKQKVNSKSKLPQCIVLIDGTWKKSYKMYQINEALHHIPHLTLPDDVEGEYRIRKTQKEHALSSLEACVYALMSLESNAPQYQPLLERFKQFNDFQLSFNPNN